MAHVEKYRAEALGGMLGHYERWGGDADKITGRDNIDPSLTPLNYNLGPEREGTQREFIDQRIASLKLKRKPRKDAVRMCDCVLTVPRSLDPSRRDDFFRSAYGFLSERYGSENVVSAWVHLDEPDAMPHMHFSWVPVTGDGRLSAKDVCSRADWRTLHQDMQQHLENELGCSVEVLLDEGKQGEKQLSRLNQKEYRAAKKKLSDTKKELGEAQKELKAQTERLERVRRAADGLESVAERVAVAEHAPVGGKGEGFGGVVRACADVLGELVNEFPGRLRALCEAALGEVAAWFSDDAPKSGPAISLGAGGDSTTPFGGVPPVVGGGDGPQKQKQKTRERHL